MPIDHIRDIVMLFVGAMGFGALVFVLFIAF